MNSKLFYPTNNAFFWNISLVSNSYHISQTGKNPVLFCVFTAKSLFSGFRKLNGRQNNWDIYVLIFLKIKIIFEFLGVSNPVL